MKRIIKAIKFSINGLVSAFRTEPAFRQELLLAMVAACVVSYFDFSAVERILLMGSILIVLIVELLNTAVEKTIDRISKEHHPLSGLVKDTSSAAVLLSILLMLLCWGMIVWEKLS